MIKLNNKHNEEDKISETDIFLLSERKDKEYKVKTMALSIKEGYFGGLSQTLSNQFITPYAFRLNVTSTQIGILTALLGIISPLGQLLGSDQMKNTSRRNLVIKGVFFQSLMWPLFILLGIFQFNNWLLSFLPILLMVFVLFYSFFGAIAGPSWFSLMGDIVPDDYRGRYFSKRNLSITAISILITILSSILLEQFRDLNREFIGFFIIFFMAFISRIISAIFLSRHYYPPFKIEKQSYMSIKQFLKNIPKNNFGVFTLYITFLHFSVNIGVPFMGYYMLETLNFNYIEYTTVSLSTPLLSLFFYPIIGHLSDKYGNALVLRICGFLLPILPILWIICDTPWQLILGPQLISAFAWTGVNLSSSNFIYDSISTQQRGFYSAYVSFAMGIGVLFGGLLGSALLQFIPITFLSIYETLFLISGFTRLIVDCIFLFRIKEVRLNKINGE